MGLRYDISFIYPYHANYFATHLLEIQLYHNEPKKRKYY